MYMCRDIKFACDFSIGFWNNFLSFILLDTDQYGSNLYMLALGVMCLMEQSLACYLVEDESV